MLVLNIVALGVNIEWLIISFCLVIVDGHLVSFRDGLSTNALFSVVMTHFNVSV